MENGLDENIEEFQNRFSYLNKSRANWDEYEQLYYELKDFEKNKLTIEQKLTMIYLKMVICEHNADKVRENKSIYEECLSFPQQLIEMRIPGLKIMYIQLISKLVQIDSNKALSICNKIILNEKFREKNELDDVLNTIVSLKMECLKNLILQSSDKNMKKVYNSEIINCYDMLIQMYSNNKNGKENDYTCLFQKLDYLSDNLDGAMNITEDNLNYCLTECNKLLKDNKFSEHKVELYKYKIEALLNLQKYNEVIYCYEMEAQNVKHEIELHECFKYYVVALYNLNRYSELLDKMESHLMHDEFMKILFYVNIGKYDNRSELFDKALNLIKESSSNYDELKIECLKGLKKASTDDNKKKILESQIQDLYYKGLDSDDKLMNNSQANSIFVQELLENKDEGNDVLYHYTNMDALKGIIENRELWITKSAFLNDFAETKHVKKIFDNITKNINYEENKGFKNILSSVKFGIDYYFDESVNEEGIECSNEIKRYIEENLKIRLKDSYIMSLSTNKDSITLWGNYSNNEGYNIGFKKDKLINYFRKSSSKNFSNVIAGKVIYKDNVSSSKDIGEDEMYKVVLMYYNDCKNREIDDEKIICGIIGNLIFIGLFIKLKAFEHEDEYRIVYLREDISDENIRQLLGLNFKTNFKIKAGSFIPYMKLPTQCDESIAEINIGPNNKSDIAEEGLKQILQSNGYNAEKIKIDHSGITLRY